MVFSDSLLWHLPPASGSEMYPNGKLIHMLGI